MKLMRLPMPRRRYRTIIGEARFKDNSTGICQNISGTSWYIKNFNNIPGYFLRIGNTFKEFPAACFESTTNKPNNQENKDA
jgi:hypothetical protein